MLCEYSNYPIDQFRRGLTLKQCQESVHHAKVNKGSPYDWKLLPQPLGDLDGNFCVFWHLSHNYKVFQHTIITTLWIHFSAHLHSFCISHRAENPSFHHLGISLVQGRSAAARDARVASCSVTSLPGASVLEPLSMERCGLINLDFGK